MLRRLSIGVFLAGVVVLGGAERTASAVEPAAPESDKPAPPSEPPSVKAVGAVDPTTVPASQRPATKPGPFALPTDFPDKPRFVVIELQEEVSLGMAAFVQRVSAELHQDDILVLDIKTFGGRVDAAVTIRDALLHAEDSGAQVVAYINPRAISAGALISFAADVIVVAPAATMGAATPVSVEGGEMKQVDQKVVSYMRTEMRATAEARGRNGSIAEAMVDPDVEVDGLDDKGSTLTLDGKRLLEWGIASFEAKDLDAVISGLGYDAGSFEMTTVKWSWAEKIAAWLSGSVISGLLMSLGMLGIMIGLYTGGSPVALGLGGTCLALFFFGHHVVNLAGIEDILLLLGGFVLIGIEFMVPGHIFFGVIGLLCVLGALFLGLIDFSRVDFDVQWKAGYVASALSTVLGSVLATILLTFAAFKFLPSTSFGRGLVLTTAINARASDKVQAGTDALIGQIGEAATALRPSGKITIGGRRYDAQADRGFVEQGAPIKVIKADGFHLVVTPVKQESA